ncbi:MAG: hypothetical protein V1705_01045, partial [bacterium]
MGSRNSESEYISLQDATKYCGYSQEYLSLRARQQKLKAVKFGRNWVTKKEWLLEYLRTAENHDHVQSSQHSGLPPANLPVEGLDIKNLLARFAAGQTIRAGFLAALAFSLIITGGVYGKGDFKKAFSVLDRGINNFSNDIGWGIGQSFAGVFNDANIFVSALDPGVSDFSESISQGIGQSFGQSFAGAFGDAQIFSGFFDNGSALVAGRLSAALENWKSLVWQQAEEIMGFGNNVGWSVAEVGSQGGESLKGYFSWIGRGYSSANNLVDRKLKEVSQTAMEGLDNLKVGSQQIVKNIKEAPKVVGYLWQAEKKEEGLAPISVKEEPEAPAPPVVKETVREVIREVEVSKITKIEPIKQIETVKEIIKIDDAAIAKVRADIIDLQSEVAKRLYAPGGVITQQIYVKEPVSSPKIYQENGDIVLQTVGSGNVILSAATGMQIAGSQVVIDSLSTTNPMIYINDKLRVNGPGEIMGPLTAQKITLNNTIGSGIPLDVQINGESKFSVDNSGNTTLTGNFTLTGDMVVTGNKTLSGLVSIATSSASSTLTVTQNGGGHIVDFYDGSNMVFSLVDGGYATLAVAASTTPAFLIRAPDTSLTFATSTYFGIAATSTFVGRFADFAKSGSESLFYVDSSGNLMATGTLTVAATTTLAVNGGYVGISTANPTQQFQVNDAAAAAFVVTSAGNVGIGTTTPSEMLTVWGGMRVGASSTPVLYVASSTSRVGISTTTPSETLSVRAT